MRFAVIALLGFLVTTEAIKLTKEEEEEEDHSKEVFEAREIGTGPLDKKYERVPPEHFTAGSDDLFMKSMIMTYAVEHKNKDGTPNGVFGMSEAATKAASSEVLETPKALMGLENLRGSGLGGSLGHTENTVWSSVLVLVLNSVGHDHRLHEEIVGSSGEMLGWDSLVFLIEWAGADLSGLEDFLGVVLLFLLFLSELDGLSRNKETKKGNNSESH